MKWVLKVKIVCLAYLLATLSKHYTFKQKKRAKPSFFV
jgi:hypothetical protein